MVKNQVRNAGNNKNQQIDKGYYQANSCLEALD